MVTRRRMGPSVNRARSGGVLGARAPLRETEVPVVRPYMLVDDIQRTVDTAAQSGAVGAVPPMELLVMERARS